MQKDNFSCASTLRVEYKKYMYFKPGQNISIDNILNKFVSPPDLYWKICSSFFSVIAHSCQSANDSSHVIQMDFLSTRPSNITLWPPARGDN